MLKLFLGCLLPIVAHATDLPDPHITPGATDSAVTQENIQDTICVKGYTKTIRPPAYVTNKLKKHQIRQYGFQDTNKDHYEEDHLISLNIGGAGSDPNNLWPQTKLSYWNAMKKDTLERAMNTLVCNGDVRLEDAQREMAGNWIEAYKTYVQSKHPKR